MSNGRAVRLQSSEGLGASSHRNKEPRLAPRREGGWLQGHIRGGGWCLHIWFAPEWPCEETCSWITLDNGPVSSQGPGRHRSVNAHRRHRAQRRGCSNEGHNSWSPQTRSRYRGLCSASRCSKWTNVGHPTQLKFQVNDRSCLWCTLGPNMARGAHVVFTVLPGIQI